MLVWRSESFSPRGSKTFGNFKVGDKEKYKYTLPLAGIPF